MITAFDAAAALSDGVNDPQDAWRFITAFSAQWTTALADQDQFTSDEIADAEARLDITLPPVLRDAYLLFGRRADFSWQDPFLAPAHLHFEDSPDGRILIFRTENQGGWAWGIAEHDLTRNDPPALLYSDFCSRPGWTPLLDRTSAALVEAVLSEQGMHQDFDGGKLSRRRTLSPDFLTALEATYPRTNLPAAPWNCGPDGSFVCWHAGPGRIVEIIDTGGHASEARLFTQTEEHLQQALAALPGPWAMPFEPRERQEPPQLPPGIDDPWAVPGGYFSG